MPMVTMIFNNKVMDTPAVEKKTSIDSRNRGKLETGGRETGSVPCTLQQVPDRGLATWRPGGEIGVRVRVREGG